jgi:hypothetical protein
MRNIAFLAAFLCAALPAAAQESATPERIIRVTGTGSASAAPDIARITLGATAEAESAAEAMDSVSETIGRVIDALAGAGIEARDIATESVTLNPVHERSERDAPPGIRGYRAANRLGVTVREVDALGSVLDAATKAGATDVGDVSFGFADPKTLFEEARRAAFDDARRRAVTYAEAAGAALGPAMTIVEAGQSPGPRGDFAMMAAEARSVPIAPGEREVSASVGVTFALE